jgi:hypothetical protein
MNKELISVVFCQYRKKTSDAIKHVTEQIIWHNTKL